METPKRNYFSKAISTFLIITIALFIGYRYGHTEAQSVAIPPNITGVYNPNASTTDFTLFWKVWNLLDQKFATTKNKPPISDQDKLYGAMKGLAEAYGDPYTTFFPPEDTKAFESQIEGNFEGVGMEVSTKEGVLIVVSPLKGSPAEKAGVKPGDKVLKIDQTLTSTISVDQAIKIIRGPKGTKVTLTIVREGSQQPIEISIIRDVINIPTLETKMLDNNIFLIHLYTFTAQSPNLFKDAMRSFVQSGSKKLILDVRGNPGGYLDAAVDMASWFLPVGSVVVSEDFGGSQDTIYHRSKGYNVIGDGYKMVILVDGGSASASEILAGALNEYGKAKLVGTQTFGKGSVQEYIPVSDSTALKVTVARWLTPKGVSISEEGLKPDVVVEFTKKDAEEKKDPQLDRAVQLLSQ